MRLAILAVATAAVTAVTVMPATAASSVNTTVTFTVSATDGLNITAPSTAALSNVAPGGAATGSLGLVSVSDQRSLLNATWIATVTITTPFHTGAGSADETIPGFDVDYDPGAAINPVNGPFDPGTAGTLTSTRTAFSRTSGSGNNSVSWNPTVTVNVPTSAVFGSYSGVLTHAVS
jgi:hypothetical protein